MKRIFQILCITCLAAAILSFIAPYLDQSIPGLPATASYEKAIGKELPESIARAAKENGCDGYILPVPEIDGKPAGISSLTDDLNLVLASFKNWRVACDENTYQRMQGRLDESLKRWGGLLTGTDLEKIASNQLDAIAKTSYFAQAQLVPLPERKKSGNPDFKIILSVYKNIQGVLLFSETASFLSPPAYNAAIKEREDAINRARILQLTTRVSFWAAIFSGGLIVLLVLIQAIQALNRFIRRRSTMTKLKKDIANRQDLIDNGHFVAADRLSEKYLQYFPDDVEIQAFRERLLDYTLNDPKKTQMAFVEKKRLELRLKKFGSNPDTPLLTADDRLRINEGKKHLPELGYIQEKAEAAESIQSRKQEKSEKIREVEDYLRTGWLDMAQDQLSTLVKEYPDDLHLRKLAETVQVRKTALLEKINDLYAKLKTGDVAGAVDALEQARSEYRDHAGLNELKNQIDQVAGESQFVLKPVAGSGKTVEISAGQGQKHMEGTRLFWGAGVCVAVSEDSYTVLRPGIRLKTQNQVYLVELVQ